MKRVLGVSPYSASRYVYVMTGALPLVEIIRGRLSCPNTEAFNMFSSEWKIKNETAYMELAELSPFHDRDLWARPNSKRRHIFTRFMVHGYHHLLCSTEGYHHPGDTCVCRRCNEFCEKYHSIICTYTSSLTEFSVM